jgi:hypothetical protein
VVADIAVSTDYGALHYMGESPDPGARTDIRALAQGRGMNEHRLVSRHTRTLPEVTT